MKKPAGGRAIRVDRLKTILIMSVASATLMLSTLAPFFWTIDNIENIVSQAAIPAILALGACFVIGSGQIDLSIGSILALCALLFGEVSNRSSNTLLAALAAVGLGAAAGAVNGLLALRVPSFIVTLGSMASYRGIALLATSGQSVTLNGSKDQFDEVSVRCLVTIAAAVALSTLLSFRRTRFGLIVLAVGSNIRAARNLGINVGYFRAAVLAISGGLAGLAAALLTLRLGAARPTAGVGYELDAIAATIIGGTALGGGQVSVLGACAATLLLSMLRTSLTLLNVDPAMQQVAVGIMLVAVVLTQDPRL